MKAKAYFPVIGFFKIVALMALILGIGFGIDGHADDTVEQALKNLAVALQADPNLAPETKAALSEVIQALESEREAAPSKQNVPQPPPAEQQSRFDKFSFYGDLRLRHESSLHQDTTPDRHRERLRFRIGTKIEVSPELTIGARLVTGNPDDPKSTHQTLGDDYDSFEVSFDRVYLNYIPDWSKNSWATVGKFGDPFTRNPIFDGLVWDSDVQPEGLAVGHTFDSIAGLDHIRLVLGQYILKERGLEDDAYVSVGKSVV